MLTSQQAEVFILEGNEGLGGKVNESHLDHDDSRLEADGANTVLIGNPTGEALCI